jgi:hypothetical protein
MYRAAEAKRCEHPELHKRSRQRNADGERGVSHDRDVRRVTAKVHAPEHTRRQATIPRENPRRR